MQQTSRFSTIVCSKNGLVILSSVTTPATSTVSALAAALLLVEPEGEPCRHLRHRAPVGPVNEEVLAR